MRFMAAASVLVLLLVVFCPCHGQLYVGARWQSPDWVSDEQARVFNLPERRLELMDLSRGGSPYLEFGGQTITSLTELSRVFNIEDGQAMPDGGPLMNKMLLSLPLLRQGNGLELLMRPNRDVYVTMLKQLTVGSVHTNMAVPAPGCVAIDTHVHTCESPDSLADPAQMVRAAAKSGLSGIAITDHNTMQGVSAVQRAADRLIRRGLLPSTFLVIPGEEMSSSEGHIIGLFLTREIQSGLTAKETIDAIHAQGGIAIAAHPLLPHSLGKLAKTLPFDAVETMNNAEELAFAVRPRSTRNRRANFYATVEKPRIGSSDAHDPQSLAACYTCVQCSASPEDVRAAILAGKTSPMRSVSGDHQRSIAGRGPLRALALVQSATDLSPLLQRLTHTNRVTLLLAPTPRFAWDKKF
jgi:predicted metal-dependent phosphoesterase TrpH